VHAALVRRDHPRCEGLTERALLPIPKTSPTPVVFDRRAVGIASEPILIRSHFLSMDHHNRRRKPHPPLVTEGFGEELVWKEAVRKRVRSAKSRQRRLTGSSRADSIDRRPEFSLLFSASIGIDSKISALVILARWGR